ncbi:MAG: CtsR family transcriptional regulator [Clostridia bacterium]|nr:CtsR family transcriptional regulator [Clostridia bacterium]
MNKSVSDIIEEFIMSSLDTDDFIELSRNDLAKFFSCVPSQINYVLNTRFTINRGFVVESQRGGSGYIKVIRVQDNDDNFLSNALEYTSRPLNVVEAQQILEQLETRKLITKREANLVKSSVSPKALNNPLNMDDVLRSNIIRQVIVEIMKMKQEGGKN